MPFRDGASIRKERINMSIDLVEKNPGIEVKTWEGIVYRRTGLTSETIQRMLAEICRYNLLEEIDGSLYPFNYYKIKKIKDESQHVSAK